jgi:hypothetical protein
MLAEDARTIAARLCEIVDAGVGSFGSVALWQRNNFAWRLIVQLHQMRIRPSLLLTTEGVDAVTAVALALGKQHRDTRGWTLPQAWRTIAELVNAEKPRTLFEGAAEYVDTTSGHRRALAPRFANKIRVA